MKRSGSGTCSSRGRPTCVCLARWKTMGRKRFRSKTRNSTRGAQRTCRREARAEGQERRTVDVNNASLASDMVGSWDVWRGHHCRPASEWRHGRALPHHQPPPLGHDCCGDGADGRRLESDLRHHLYGGVWHRRGRHDSLLEQVAPSIEPRRTLPVAVKRSFLATGKAIVVTSLILCGGFAS